MYIKSNKPFGSSISSKTINSKQNSKDPAYVNLEKEKIDKDKKGIIEETTNDPRNYCIDRALRGSGMHEYECLTTEHQDGPTCSTASTRTSGGVEGTARGPDKMGKSTPEHQIGLVLFGYEAQQKDELTITRGLLIEIISKECEEDGWVLARLVGHESSIGMVPREYVALVGSQPKLIQPDTLQRSNHQLGSGGFADVWRGIFKGQEVALKIPRGTQDSGALKREALILSRLCHENIVHFLGMSLDPMLIVLELCEGGTLSSLYRKMCASDVLTVIYWAKQVASAIEHMHKRDEPLVYADMKAENVLIKERPCTCGLANETWKNVTNYLRGSCRKCGGMCINQLTLKLADFNVTRTIGVKRDSISGSLPWMSPEAIQNRDVQPSADIWSFAMFLWELFSRKVPFNNHEMVIILSTIITKEGHPQPLPDDLPGELRKVFDGCWKKRHQERPSIAEVRAQLEEAERSVDNNYKWVLQEGSQREAELEHERRNAQLLLDDLNKSAGPPISSINVPLYEVLLYLEHLGGQKPDKGDITGVVENKLGSALASWYPPPEPKKRQKKPTKLNKSSIGTPSDFRHHVSAEVCKNNHGNGNFNDRTLIIRYTDDELMNSLALRRQLHRSHDSVYVLDCNREENGDDGDSGFSTLPRGRGFRHQQSSDKQNNIERGKCPHRKCHHLDSRLHPCCTKLVASTFGLKPKSAKSSPELNILDLKTRTAVSGNKLPSQQKMARYPMGANNCQIDRRHDYLSLMPCGCLSHNCHHRPNFIPRMIRDQYFPDGIMKSEGQEQSQKERLEPSWRNGLGAAGRGDEDDSGGGVPREYVNLEMQGTRKLSRANAVRKVIGEATDSANGNTTESECMATTESSRAESCSSVTTPNGGAVAEESSSSADLSGFVLVGDCGGEPTTATTLSQKGGEGNNRRSGKDSQDLSDLFNRRLSPPHTHHSLSPNTAKSRRSISGELERIRQSEISNSIFYMPSEEIGEDTQTPLDELCATPSRRRSTASSGAGNHRSITSLLSNLIGGTKSPRNLAAANEREERPEREDTNITEAHCFHPHHEMDQHHLCALRSVAEMLPEICLLRVQELQKGEFIPRPSSTPGCPSHPNPPNKMFIKKGDYPEKQRQRHRTESATAQQPPPVERRTKGTERGNSPVCPLAPPEAAAVTVPRHSHSSHNDLSILNTAIPLFRQDPHRQGIVQLRAPLFPQQNSSLLLSPDGPLPLWHQRSRSSDCPGGNSSASQLLELLRCQPMPSADGLIVNPSYVPMVQEGNSGKKMLPNNPAPAIRKDVPIPLPPPSQPSQQQQRPVPRPRTTIPTKKTERDPSREESLAHWPTSQAPTLNRAEMGLASEQQGDGEWGRGKALATLIPNATAEPATLGHGTPSSSESESSSSFAAAVPAVPMSELRRPNTLCLAPPPVPGHPSSPGSPSSTPTTSASLFTNSSNSLGNSNTATTTQTLNSAGVGPCDSGLCASSGGATEGENSPQGPSASAKNACSVTMFSCSPTESPTTLVIGGGTGLVPPPPDSLWHSHTVGGTFQRRSAASIPPPPESAPPPVPAKHSGHRVPPLPKNGRVLMRGGDGGRQ